MFIVQISRLVQRTVQFTHWYWNSLFHDLIFLRRMQRIIHATEAIHTISIFRSTRYPLLLGGQRQCRFKSCPTILYVTSSVPGIEPQTFRSQVQHLTTEPRTLLKDSGQSTKVVVKKILMIPYDTNMPKMQKKLYVFTVI